MWAGPSPTSLRLPNHTSSLCPFTPHTDGGDAACCRLPLTIPCCFWNFLPSIVSNSPLNSLTISAGCVFYPEDPDAARANTGSGKWQKCGEIQGIWGVTRGGSSEWGPDMHIAAATFRYDQLWKPHCVSWVLSFLLCKFWMTFMVPCGSSDYEINE